MAQVFDQQGQSLPAAMVRGSDARSDALAYAVDYVCCSGDPVLVAGEGRTLIVSAVRGESLQQRRAQVPGCGTFASGADLIERLGLWTARDAAVSA